MLNALAKYLLVVVVGATSVPLKKVLLLIVEICPYRLQVCFCLHLQQDVMGALFVGVPLFFYLEKVNSDSFINVVLWPAAFFAFVIYVLFGVYHQNSCATFATFSLSWVFAATTFWLAAHKMTLTSASVAEVTELRG